MTTAHTTPTPATDVSVTTWANGFGMWHARVPVSPSAAHVARHAIREELKARGATGNGAPLYLKRAEDFNPTPGTIVYAER